MERLLTRLSISLLTGFAITATLSACSQNAKPTIAPGTVFTQVAPGSRVYREVKNRPMIKDFNAKR
ncbi:hypothetical protein NC981_21555 [Leptolyngbya sp. DQ-M1]|uniref:hypothetical protein n=1 Tax=Leptolyngbya sp. DQ-M1 TaxID=2933920 RepID=UPI0032982314